MSGYKRATADLLEAEGSRKRPLPCPSLEEPEQTSGKRVAGVGDGQDPGEDVGLGTLGMLSTLHPTFFSSI